MYYVYLLKNQKNKIYFGYTSDLKRRVEEHNVGKSPYTSIRGPWTLVYYEAFKSEKDAKIREKMLKHDGRGLGHLKKRIQSSINED